MIPYLLHVALLITVCLLFYKLLLQHETFYKLNRWILLCCMLFAFVLPLLQIPANWSLRNEPAITVIEQPTINSFILPQQQNVTVLTKDSVSPALVKPAKQNASDAVPLMPRVLKWLFYIYWIGVAAFGLNLLLQLVVLLYQAYTKPFVRDGIYRIVELSGDKAPCSFGNNIFINPEKYDWDTYNQILLHEKIHIQQGHSFDILLAELLLVFQWFNPFAWFYRKELENNLEFLTDDAVLHHKEVDRSSYQMSLLKVSVPNLALGITINYNQSLLKKRIIMMNAKKSNLHIMWKYFILVPLLGCLVCALNEPMKALAQTAKPKADANPKVKVNPTVKVQGRWSDKDRSEGSWFGTIKKDEVRIDFKSDNDDHNWSNGSSFKVSEFTALPRDQKGEFKLVREAGIMVFNGKFDGNEGMGHYKFTADKTFAVYLKKEGISEIDDNDDFAFFLINVKKDYVQMLKANGFNHLSKNDLISMAALKVDEPYIKFWKENGYKGLTAQELVSGKALGIDAAYVADIRKAGYKDLSFNQLVSFKAQHITGDYINGLKKGPVKVGDASADGLPSPEQVSSFKAMNVDSAFISSWEKAGYKSLSYNELTSLKALNITPEFIKAFKDLGYDDIPVNSIMSLKSLHITPEYIKSFQNIGYKDIPLHELEGLKATGVTPEYVKSFKDAGYQDVNLNNLVALKSMGVTPDFAKGFKAIGFSNLSLNEMTTLKATGVTPAYITSMRQKGFKSNDINKYVQLKTAFN